MNQAVDGYRLDNRQGLSRMIDIGAFVSHGQLRLFGNTIKE